MEACPCLTVHGTPPLLIPATMVPGVEPITVELKFAFWLLSPSSASVNTAKAATKRLAIKLFLLIFSSPSSLIFPLLTRASAILMQAQDCSCEVELLFHCQLNHPYCVRRKTGAIWITG